MRRITIIGVVALFINSTLGYGASTPSLQETTDWLASMLANTTWQDAAYTYKMLHNGCLFRSVSQIKNIRSDKSILRYIEEFNLDSLDPFSTEVGTKDGNSSWVLLRTSGSRPLIKHVQEAISKSPSFAHDAEVTQEPDFGNFLATSFTSSIAFWVANHETADRLARGFKHAISLCGGKVDPF